jgi:hypothetical protein
MKDPEIMDKISDVVLAYRYQRKRKKGKRARRRKTAKK